MNCTVEGYPVESVEWLHDGVPVLTAQDTRIRLLAPLVLVIGSVGRRDKGMYQCLVRSDKENAQATAELKLGGQRTHRPFLLPVTPYSPSTVSIYSYITSLYICTYRVLLLDTLTLPCFSYVFSSLERTGPFLLEKTDF